MSRTNFNPAIGKPAALLTQLKALAGGAGELLAYGQSDYTDGELSWLKHRVVLAFDGAPGVTQGEKLIDALPDNVWAIVGWSVTHAEISRVDQSIAPEEWLIVSCEFRLMER